MRFTKTLAFLAAIILLSSCGTKKADDEFSKYTGKFFTISFPKDFRANENDNMCTVVGPKFGIAVGVTKGTNFMEGAKNLGSFSQDFKGMFKDSKVEDATFAGFPALYLESKQDSATSLGYAFLLDGAMITVNASLVPEDSVELATKIISTFEVTNKTLFKPAKSDAEITQFGPSEGEPIQFDTIMLMPPKGWRILDNSTPDFINIEPKEDNKEDQGNSINITTTNDSELDAKTTAEKMAARVGAKVNQTILGDLHFWSYVAEYQQRVYVYMISFGKRLHIVTITSVYDELPVKMSEFLANLAFKK